MLIQCKYCGGATELAGYVSFPRKTIVKCMTCERLTWLDGKKWVPQQPPGAVVQEQPQPTQQQQSKTDDEDDKS